MMKLSYDQSYRLTRLKDTLGTTVLRDVNLGWTNRDNLLSVTDSVVSTISESYSYNQREWLKGARACCADSDSGFP